MNILVQQEIFRLRRTKVVTDDRLESLFREFRPQELGFFHPDAPEPSKTSGTSGTSVRQTKATVYRDIDSFEQRVNEYVHLVSENSVRENLSLCFRGSAMTWYMREINDFTRKAFRIMPLKDFLHELHKRFSTDAPEKSFSQRSSQSYLLMHRLQQQGAPCSADLIQDERSRTLVSTLNRLTTFKGFGEDLIKPKKRRSQLAGDDSYPASIYQKPSQERQYSRCQCPLCYLPTQTTIILASPNPQAYRQEKSALQSQIDLHHSNPFSARSKDWSPLGWQALIVWGW